MALARPKLLYILHSYFNRAGTEIHTKQLKEGLECEFDIFIVFPERNRIRLLGPSGLDETYDGSHPIWPETPYKIESMNRSLALILEKVAPDCIHLQHFLNWPLSVVDQITAFGAPVAVTLHDYYAITPYFTFEDVDDAMECATPAYSQKFFRRDISHYIRERQKVLAESLKKAKRLIAPSAYLASHYEKIFPNTYQVIEHGIIPFECHKEAPPENVDLRFGYMGGLIPQKGWDLLLEAFLILRTTNPRVELHFFGGLDQSGTIWEGTHFHGIYENKHLPQICNQIDVGVIPSLVPETYCLVLSEFWMSKTPVAVSATGALKDRVSDFVNGRKFQPKNLVQMVNTLRWFTESTEWRSWNLPRPRHLESMIEDYRNLYRELLERNAP